MADASRDRLVLKPAGWTFPEAERQLHSEADQIPTLRLANLSRRCLADICHQLSEEFQSGRSISFADMSPEYARRTVCVNLGIVVVRASGAAISLVSCGYEPEALAPARTVLEALYRTQHARKDTSGEVARDLLRGRSSRSLKGLATKYGDPDEIAFLDRFSHADVLSLMALHSKSPEDGVTEIDMRPGRDYRRAAAHLHTLAHSITTMSAQVCDEFGVDCEMPPYLHERFAYYRDNPIFPAKPEQEGT